MTRSLPNSTWTLNIFSFLPEILGCFADRRLRPNWLIQCINEVYCCTSFFRHVAHVKASGGCCWCDLWMVHGWWNIRWRRRETWNTRFAVTQTVKRRTAEGLQVKESSKRTERPLSVGGLKSVMDEKRKNELDDNVAIPADVRPQQLRSDSSDESWRNRNDSSNEEVNACAVQELLMVCWLQARVCWRKQLEIFFTISG